MTHDLATGRQSSGAAADFVTIALLGMSPLWLLVIGPFGAAFFSDEPGTRGTWETTGVGLIIFATAIGIALLWRSQAWSKRDKLIAAAGVVVGLLQPASNVFFYMFQRAVLQMNMLGVFTAGETTTALLAVLCVGISLAAAMYLIIRRRATTAYRH